VFNKRTRRAASGTRLNPAIHVTQRVCVVCHIVCLTRDVGYRWMDFRIVTPTLLTTTPYHPRNTSIQEPPLVTTRFNVVEHPRKLLVEFRPSRAGILKHTSQTRRLARPTRITAVKENENANARISRISTRTKPNALAAGSSISTAPVGGVARATAASRAKAATADPKADLHAGKRKREALGEVAVAGNKPSGAALKGKGKETFDGVVLKARSATARQPLRTVASRTTANITVKDSTKEIKQEVKPEKEVITVTDDNAMVIDVPHLPSLTARRSKLAQESISIAPRRPEVHRHISSRSTLSSRKKAEEDDEDEPAHKKRRTSSVPPDEDPQVLEAAHAQAEEEAALTRLTAEMEAFAEEPEADPEDSSWDDLDAEDFDDPTMVSEYVQDIFKYLKQVEVKSQHFPRRLTMLTFIRS